VTDYYQMLAELTWNWQIINWC